MDSWNDSEKIEYFLHSLKAERLCSEVRKVFNICRASPFGKVIDPGLCALHAKNLIDCFEEAKDVYPPCNFEYKNAIDCITQGTSSSFSFASCEKEVEKYQDCFHPSLDKYKGYEASFRTEQK